MASRRQTPHASTGLWNRALYEMSSGASVWSRNKCGHGRYRTIDGEADGEDAEVGTMLPVFRLPHGRDTHTSAYIGLLISFRHEFGDGLIGPGERRLVR